MSPNQERAANKHRMTCSAAGAGCTSYRTVKQAPDEGTVWLCRKCWRAIEPGARDAVKAAFKEVRRWDRHVQRGRHGEAGKRRFRWACRTAWDAWDKAVKEATIMVAMGAR